MRHLLLGALTGFSLLFTAAAATPTKAEPDTKREVTFADDSEKADAWFCYRAEKTSKALTCTDIQAFLHYLEAREEKPASSEDEAGGIMPQPRHSFEL